MDLDLEGGEGGEGGRGAINLNSERSRKRKQADSGGSDDDSTAAEISQRKPSESDSKRAKPEVQKAPAPKPPALEPERKREQLDDLDGDVDEDELFMRKVTTLWQHTHTRPLSRAVPSCCVCVSCAALLCLCVAGHRTESRRRSAVLAGVRLQGGRHGARSETPIRDTSCCEHPLTGAPYLRPGPRRRMQSGSPIVPPTVPPGPRPTPPQPSLPSPRPPPPLPPPG